MPRKMSLTKEVIDSIAKAISNGLNNNDACSIAGVSRASFYSWLKDAEEALRNPEAKKKIKHVGLKLELLDAIKNAESKYKLFHLQNIMQASRSTWQASAWILERKYPEEFGKIDRAAILVNNGKDNGMLPELLEFFKMKANGIDVKTNQDNELEHDASGEY